MPNKFIELIDKGTFSPTETFEALSEVPYLQHQFSWCIETWSKLSEDESIKSICGYTGIKKITPVRLEALKKVRNILLSPEGEKLRDEIESLPHPVRGWKCPSVVKTI